MRNPIKLEELEAEVAMGNDTELVPVHISPEETMYFNIMQGGQSVDERTGLREYSKLSDILRIPEIRNVFILISDIIMTGKEVPDDVLKLMNTPLEKEEEGIEPIESDYDPEIQHLSAMGEGKDKVLVMMPKDVERFLDFVQGGEKHDPKIGLQEFGFFEKIGNIVKSVARVGATVAGAILGGPLGAAAGNMLGRVVTGQKIGMDMLSAGAKNGLYAWGASGAMGAMGSQIGAMGSTAGGLAGLQAGMGFGAGAGAGGVGSAASHQGGAPVINGHTGAAHIFGKGATATAGAGAGGVGSMFSKAMSSPMLPAAALLGSAYVGKMGDDKKEKENQRRYAESREDIERHRRQELGYLTNPYELEMTTHPVPVQSTMPQHYNHRSGDRVRSYKTGGKVSGIEIKGKGTGQSDDIPKTVPENSWVWDATTVAHAGDGTTNAGQKAIEMFEKILKTRKLPRVKHVIEDKIKHKPLRSVPCALSNGERVTPPHLVAAAGDGSFDRGADILRKMTKELRRHKSSKGLDLPPSAHELEIYYKRALHGR